MTLKYKIQYTSFVDEYKDCRCSGVVSGDNLTDIVSKINEYYIGTHSDFDSLYLEIPFMEGDPPDGLVELTDE